MLTRADNRKAIERDALAGNPNLSFVYFDLPRWAQRCRKGFGKILYYVLWQWCAVRHIRKLFPALPFDVVQHVTYASGRYPSFMASLGIPFYFGPVSGGETIPGRIRSNFSFAERCREHLRDWSNFVVPRDPLMRWVFQRADKLVVTPDTLALVPARWRHKCQAQLAVGLTSEYLNHAGPRTPSSGNELRLLYVGRLLEWKGLDLALQAVSQFRQSGPKIHFTIVGDGPANRQLHSLAEDLGLSETVDWVAWVPHNCVENYYSRFGRALVSQPAGFRRYGCPGSHGARAADSMHRPRRPGCDCRSRLRARGVHRAQEQRPNCKRPRPGAAADCHNACAIRFIGSRRPRSGGPIQIRKSCRLPASTGRITQRRFHHMSTIACSSQTRIA